MTKRMVIMLIAVAIVFGGIFGFQAFKAAMIKKFMSSMQAPPQTVSATKAELSPWQPQIEAVGSLRAVRGRRSVARGFRRRRFDLVQFRRRRQGRGGVVEAAFRRRRGQA